MKKLIFPALFTIAASLSIALPPKSHSQMVACSRDGNIPSEQTDSAFATANSEGCSATPDKYEIVIYEMGLCTGGTSPTAGGTLNRTNCTATFTSSGGQTVDLAGSASITLDSSNSTAPSPNTYTWGYMVMANTFGLRGSLQTSQSTWVSTSDGSASNTESTAADFSESLINFAAE